jgi:2-(1,2-epoxy-1,2-dihydrophenyl)acetyl-CoA isomerase
MSDLVLLAESDGIATLTLNRPEKLNVLADDMRDGLLGAADRVAASADARVLVITGAGRAFCAGGDISLMARLVGRGASYDGLRPLVEAGRELVRRLAALPIPVIAAVNGPAAGGGLGLAVACDLRIASDRASFGATFVRLGLHPDWSNTYWLPRLVGLPKALELCWLGDMIDAAEALRIGLVERVIPHERFEAEVRSMAVQLASAPQVSVRMAKQALQAGLESSLDECLTREHEAQEACWSSPDVGEGVRAFVEKRPPRFGGGDRQPAEVVASHRFE